MHASGCPRLTGRTLPATAGLLTAALRFPGRLPTRLATACLLATGLLAARFLTLRRLFSGILLIGLRVFRRILWLIAGWILLLTILRLLAPACRIAAGRFALHGLTLRTLFAAFGLLAFGAAGSLFCGFTGI